MNPNQQKSFKAKLQEIFVGEDDTLPMSLEVLWHGDDAEIDALVEQRIADLGGDGINPEEEWTKHSTFIPKWQFWRTV